VTGEQPAEQTAGSEVAASSQRAESAGGRTRSVLLVVILCVLGVAVLGAATGAFLYVRASQPDRSTPTIAIRQFLSASLVDGDVTRASLFTCHQWPAADAMSAVRANRDPELQVNWGVTSVDQHGDGADAIVRITSSFGGHSDIEVWRFTLARQDGWRVCSAMRDQSLEPQS
jgi:hypothetical protein